MTEIETEQTTEPETGAPESEPNPDQPATPEEPIEGDDANQDGNEQDGEPEAPEGQPEPLEGDEADRQAQAASEQSLEKLHGQLANANKAHVSKIARIMGEDANALIPCPVCMDFVAGLIFPPEVAPLPENVQERMKQLLGFSSWEDTPSAEWAQQCPDCHGHGEVKTGSHVTGKETTRCLNCNGDGWKNLRQDSGNVAPLAVAPIETGPSVYGLEVSSDPDVQHLREKGYTVIPPMNVKTG